MSRTVKHAETREAEASLQQWRVESGQLVFVLIGISVILPTIAWVLGYALPDREYWIGMLAAVALLGGLAVLVRRMPLTLRVWIFLLLIYLAAARGLLWYTGAMARVWLVGAPILALLLAGPRSGLIASGLSVALIVLHAAGVLSGVTEGWRVTGFDENTPGVIVARAVMWLAFIVPLLVLLRKSYLFQLHTLSAERATSARLAERNVEREAVLASLEQAAAERERLEREIARAGDEERRRLGHDLHDGVSQRLAVALLRCTSLEERLAEEGSAGVVEARALSQLLQGTMEEVQQVARSLSPLEMDPRSLGPALGALARRTGEAFGVECGYTETGDVWLHDSEQTLHLYRIAQEAVNNAGKHACARSIAIRLARQDGHLQLTVEDDGKGVQSPEPGTGLGLRIMSFRAQRIGGTLALEDAPGGGTRVICRIPRGGAGEA